MAVEFNEVLRDLSAPGSLSFDITWDPGDDNLSGLMQPAQRWVEFVLCGKKYKGRIVENSGLVPNADGETSTMDVTIDNVEEIE